MDVKNKRNILPFSLTFLVVILDQISKALIVAKWPNQGTLIWPQGTTVKDALENYFLIFWHVRNKAIAFSIGDNAPQFIRVALFIVVPLIVLALLVWYYFRAAGFSKLQRWAVAGIIGGGMGNIIDRIFRTDGVVDFISVKFYGLFGLDRWPTFNLADSSVVICCLIFIFTMLTNSGRTKKQEA